MDWCKQHNQYECGCDHRDPILKWLRNPLLFVHTTRPELQRQVADEAADEIARLRARVAELERALDRLYSACMEADYHGELDARVDGSILDAAKAALEGE